MKKLIAIIIILSVIFLGMIIYKTNQKANSINVSEVNEIEQYINKIYMWKEVTKNALPNFNEINEASDLWIWETIKKNLEEYELTYEQIENEKAELFGKDLTKQLPKEGNEYFKYNQEQNKYYATEIDLDEKDDKFLLNKIEKNKNGYIIEIVEYIEDYSKNENNICIENLEEEEIQTVDINEDMLNRKEIVKNNIAKFNKKNIYLEKEDEHLIVKK